MTAQKLFEAIGRIDDEFVARAEAFLDEAGASPETHAPAKKRRISPKIARALAAAALVTAVALGVVMAIPASREAIVDGVSKAASGIAHFFGGGDPGGGPGGGAQTDTAQTEATQTDAEHSEAADGTDADTFAPETQSEALTESDAVTQTVADAPVVHETVFEGSVGFERKRAPGEETEYTELYYIKTNGLIAGEAEPYCRLLDSWDDYVAWCDECGYRRVEEREENGVRYVSEIWKDGLLPFDEEYFKERFVIVLYNVFDHVGEHTELSGYGIYGEAFEQNYNVTGPLDAAPGVGSDVSVIGYPRVIDPNVIGSVAGKYLFHLYTDANGELIFENGAAIRTYPGEPTLYELEKTPAGTDAQTQTAPDGDETAD